MSTTSNRCLLLAQFQAILNGCACFHFHGYASPSSDTQHKTNSIVFHATTTTAILFVILLFFSRRRHWVYAFLCAEEACTLYSPQAWRTKNVYLTNNLISSWWFVFDFAFWWRLCRSCLVIAWVVAQNTFRFQFVFPSFFWMNNDDNCNNSNDNDENSYKNLYAYLAMSTFGGVVCQRVSFQSSRHVVESRARLNQGAAFSPQNGFFFCC